MITQVEEGVLHQKNDKGYECWTKNGKAHRLYGPAIVHPDGSKYWMNQGLFHREDGPAIMRSNLTCSWYINGIKITSTDMFLRISKCSEEHVSWLLLKYGNIE